jgi:uncharacterized membrane protein
MTTRVEQVNNYSKIDRIVGWLCRRWILVISILLGLYTLVPFMAPVFMAMGLTIPGRVVYWIYSFLCHQLPERSYFLFGPKISYSLPEIQAVWQRSNNLLILRQFIGNPQMGWKVAWSDRMVSMYTSLWLFGVLWGVFRKKIKPLPFWGLILFLLPMAMDGTAHFFSDLSGIGLGFRASNIWLATLTQHAFSTAFYAGDALGSFNAWMRIITGILFGIGIVWFGFPILDQAFSNSVEVVEYKVQYRAWYLKEKERLTKMSLGGISPQNGLDAIARHEQEGKNVNQL